METWDAESKPRCGAQRRNHMSQLQADQSRNCLSILKQFVNEARTTETQRGVAELVLDQLEKVTAGTDPNANTGPDCTYVPRADM